jgi:hypothetical protein
VLLFRHSQVGPLEIRCELDVVENDLGFIRGTLAEFFFDDMKVQLDPTLGHLGYLGFETELPPDADVQASSRVAGVLAIAGDDHCAKSSTLPHQSEHVLAAAMIPVLNPAGVQEYLDFGIHGWAMSRCWVALKAIADTVESSASLLVDPHRVAVRLPEDFDMPPGRLNIR